MPSRRFWRLDLEVVPNTRTDLFLGKGIKLLLRARTGQVLHPHSQESLGIAAAELNAGLKDKRTTVIQLFAQVAVRGHKRGPAACLRNGLYSMPN